MWNLTISAVCAMLVAFTFSALTSCSESGAETTEIRLPTVQCESCVVTVTKALENVKGVAEVKVSLAEKQAMITYLADQTSPIALEMAVVGAGYDANDTMRDTVGYAGLPECCKLPEDQK
jgi:mercuric ion binding protein